MLCPIRRASHRVYDLWVTLLFHLFFGTTSLETESRNRLLVHSLLASDATFVLPVLHKFRMELCEMPSRYSVAWVGSTLRII